MLRALFFEYPGDPGSWLVDDEYLFGRDLLVGPLFDASRLRRMYLPPGRWIDYQTRRAYEGPGWHMIEAGAIPAVILARRGASIPHVAPAQSTRFIDWRTVRPVTFGG
jgi:alpha-D-xyloside xylohydrolase